MSAPMDSRTSRAWIRFRRLLASGVLVTASIHSQANANPDSPAPHLQAKLSGSEISLQWTGTPTPDGFELQTTEDLSQPDWQPAAITSRNQLTLPRHGDTRFFRVVSPPTLKPNRPITEARRFEILSELSQLAWSLPGDNPSQDRSAMLAQLARNPDIQAYGLATETSAWARFSDGRLLLLLNDRSPASDAERQAWSVPASGRFPLPSRTRASPGSEARPASSKPFVQLARRLPSASPRTPTPTAMPASSRAALFKATLPSIEAPVLDHLIPAFRKRGFTVSGGEASLENLRNVRLWGRDIGVFYIDSHGGVGRLSTVTTNASTGDRYIATEPVFAIASSTTVSESNERAFAAELADHQLCYALLGPTSLKGLRRESAPNPQPTGFYCLLPRFVRENWSFDAHSFVYVDTCHGGGEGAYSFIETCLDKGAGGYAGWSQAVSDGGALQTTQILFDALLGGSEILDVHPRQRPFDRLAVQNFLERSGFDQDPMHGAVWSYYESTSPASGFGLLHPSIQNMWTDEKAGELHLVGLFDPTAPAMVRIEGDGLREITATPVLRQGFASQPDPVAIICALPSRQSPSAGYVTVLQHGRPSNTLPLTQWRLEGQLSRYFAVGQPQPSASYTFQLLFRADLHPYRRFPYQPSTYLGSSAQAALGSDCRLATASGVYNDPNGIRTVEWTLAGSAVEIPHVLEPADTALDPDGTWFTASMRFQPAGITYLLINARAKAAVTVTERTVSSITGGIVTTTQPLNPVTRSFSGNGRNGSLDPVSYDILAGQGSTGGDSGFVRWNKGPAQFPPMLTVPGYAE